MIKDGYRAESIPGEKRQNTRLIKVACESCGYVARVSWRWLACGNLRCPCGDELKQEKR